MNVTAKARKFARLTGSESELTARKRAANRANRRAQRVLCAKLAQEPELDEFIAVTEKVTEWCF